MRGHQGGYCWGLLPITQLGTGSGQSLSQPSQNMTVVMLQPLRFPDTTEIQFALLREMGAVKPWLTALGAWKAPWSPWKTSSNKEQPTLMGGGGADVAEGWLGWTWTPDWAPAQKVNRRGRRDCPGEQKNKNLAQTAGIKWAKANQIPSGAEGGEEHWLERFTQAAGNNQGYVSHGERVTKTLTGAQVGDEHPLKVLTQSSLARPHLRLQVLKYVWKVWYTTCIMHMYNIE